MQNRCDQLGKHRNECYSHCCQKPFKQVELSKAKHPRYKQLDITIGQMAYLCILPKRKKYPLCEDSREEGEWDEKCSEN